MNDQIFITKVNEINQKILETENDDIRKYLMKQVEFIVGLKKEIDKHRNIRLQETLIQDLPVSLP